MPEREWNGLLDAAVARVVETMFFSALLGPAESAADLSPLPLAARVSFRGSPSGTLGVCLSSATARALAAGFLGEDEDALTDLQASQITCELANMLCGSVVSRLESQQSFALAPPQLAPVQSVMDAAAGDSTCLRSFELESGILTVSLRLHEAI